MRKIYLLMMLLAATAIQAQTRDKRLTIEVAAATGESLWRQAVRLTQTDYQVSYGTLALDSEGRCALNVYAGNHSLQVSRDGYEEAFATFDVQRDTTVRVVLHEKTRTPYALTAELTHDAYTGTDNAALTWNVEAPAFFDDFESYEPFAIRFGEWTGIDADRESAAAIVGDYPNRGTMQYAQVINPLTVDPIWWYDYPILQPYSGKQYIGFTRTQSGNANDDWLISPVITPGVDNWLSFMAKSADRYDERFQVYVTTQTDSPTQADFVRLDAGNYETADFTGWHQYAYSLDAYAGRSVKVAIRYISHYNLYGSFMLMLDDFYVGQLLPEASQAPRQAKARRAMRRSAANPNESFRLYLDGQPVATTDAYTYVFAGIAPGSHTLGVQAIYLATQSDIVSTTLDVPAASDYARVTFRVTAQSKLSPDGEQIDLINTRTSTAYQIVVADGQALLPSLPKGDYVVNIAEGAFNAYQQSLHVTGDATVDIVLTDRILDPYNITADVTEHGNGTIDVSLRWNQELAFTDSFEDYDDFATGSFGGWTTVDLDQMPVYPIALGGYLVSFPGAGDQYNPQPLAPMVFNPWSTRPAMLPTDVAVQAPTGNKTVIFFSPQQATADKWLISPELAIRDNFVLNVTVKGYEAAYPESMEFCIATEGSQPSDFTALTSVNPLPSDAWTIYQTDLSAYAGHTVRLAVHYTSRDAFFAQIDDFTVGPESGEAETIDFGNVVKYEIYLDGALYAETTATAFTLSGISDANHVVGIRAIYQDGASQTVTYDVHTATAIVALTPTPSSTPDAVYDLQGRRVSGTRSAHGIYVVQTPTRRYKVAK